VTSLPRGVPPQVRRRRAARKAALPPAACIATVPERGRRRSGGGRWTCRWCRLRGPAMPTRCRPRSMLGAAIPALCRGALAGAGAGAGCAPCVRSCRRNGVDRGLQPDRGAQLSNGGALALARARRARGAGLRMHLCVGGSGLQGAPSGAVLLQCGRDGRGQGPPVTLMSPVVRAIHCASAAWQGEFPHGRSRGASRGSASEAWSSPPRYDGRPQAWPGAGRKQRTPNWSGSGGGGGQGPGQRLRTSHFVQCSCSAAADPLERWAGPHLSMCHCERGPGCCGGDEGSRAGRGQSRDDALRPITVCRRQKQGDRALIVYEVRFLRRSPSGSGRAHCTLLAGSSPISLALSCYSPITWLAAAAYPSLGFSAATAPSLGFQLLQPRHTWLSAATAPSLGSQLLQPHHLALSCCNPITWLSAAPSPHQFPCQLLLLSSFPMAQAMKQAVRGPVGNAYLQLTNQLLPASPAVAGGRIPPQGQTWEFRVYQVLWALIRGLRASKRALAC